MTVLVAVAPPGRARLAQILSGRSLEFAAGSAEARSRLRRSSYELVVVGPHFDSSNALELIEEVLSQGMPCPVVCVQCVPLSSSQTRRSFDAFRAACSALGASEVLDLLQFPDDEAGNARVRQMIERLLEGDGREDTENR